MKKYKKYVLIIGFILTGYFLYSQYNQNLFYEHINSINREYIHSIVVRNYRENKRDIANQYETMHILDLLSACKYTGLENNPTPGLIDTQYIKFYINSEDCDIFPHISITLYQNEGEIVGSCEINHKFFELTNCDELYSYAFEITSDK